MANGEDTLMIELQNDSLDFSFPGIHPRARLHLTLQRTLRIPDDGRDWPLPPGLGRFPMRHVDDFGDCVPAAWRQHGGVMLPMYQAEAMWLSFDSDWIEGHDAEWPFALKIATGKRCAVTGDAWTEALGTDPQNYLVVPRQPWLDGYVVEKGFIRQFVAMPLGSGYSAEEQLGGEATVGGLQIEAFPMKREAFLKRWPRVIRRARARLEEMLAPCCCASPAPDMGLAPGGRMRQEVYEDPFDLSEWDLTASSRCFVHIANSRQWRQITGEETPTQPRTASDYSIAGLPWFDYYDADAKALEGSDTLSKLKSVAQRAKEKHDPGIGDGGDVKQLKVVVLEKKANPDAVREGVF
jgi:hypothetical protein